MSSRRQYQARTLPAAKWKAKDDPWTRPAAAENGRSLRADGVFVLYLPQDDAGMNASETQQIVDHLNKELSRLLRSKADDFSREVASNESLREFLDSYLLFRRRWYDFDSNPDVIAGEDDLCRRVFMVLLRISEAISLSSDIFSVSKIMSICAIYGRDNADLTQKLVSTVFKSRPSCLETLPDVSLQILITFDRVYNRTLESVQKLANKPNSKNELLEAVFLLHDTVMTLDAFLEIYPSGAGHFLSAQLGRNKNLLSSVAGVHDLLLPSLRRQSLEGELSRYLNILQQSLVKFAWDILFGCFFGDMITRLDSKLTGEAFINALLSLSSDDPNSSGDSILLSLSNQFDLSGKVHRLLREGSMFLEDSQYAQALTLLPETSAPINFSEEHKVSDVSRATDEEDAIRQSHITQIKDLFPDYDDAFLSSCLEVYDNNPEIVIQHILEGTIHPDLISTRTVPTVQHKGKGKRVEDNGKGKEKVDDRGKGKIIDVADHKVQGRFVRKSQNRDEDAVKLLNERDAGSSNQTAQLAMQLMYEDEYDDSFDDLDMNVADAGLETDSLVNLFSRTKLSDSSENATGLLPAGRKQEPSSKKQQGPRFYVKDGKLYNYKVAGAVAASSLEEAEKLKTQEEGLIFGLGPGGNVPVEENSEEEKDDEDDGVKDTSHVGGYRFRGRVQPSHQPSHQSYRQRFWSKSHNKKDLSLKKHMSVL